MFLTGTRTEKKDERWTTQYIPTKNTAISAGNSVGTSADIQLMKVQTTAACILQIEQYPAQHKKKSSSHKEDVEKTHEFWPEVGTSRSLALAIYTKKKKRFHYFKHTHTTIIAVRNDRNTSGKQSAKTNADGLSDLQERRYCLSWPSASAGPASKGMPNNEQQYKHPMIAYKGLVSNPIAQGVECSLPGIQVLMYLQNPLQQSVIESDPLFCSTLSGEFYATSVPKILTRVNSSF